MSVQELAFVRGIGDTRGALRRWKRRPAPILRSWLLGGLAFGTALLTAVTVVAYIAAPDLTPAFLPGLAYPAGLDDAAAVLGRNGLVLALHAVACVGGFIAGSSLPVQAERMTGASRWLHERARPVAFAWIVAVTVFSFCTQAYVLGSTGSALANQFGISPALLVLTVLPHALLELTAVFLPLAAWTLASRRGDWQDLLAATFATVAVAIPLLLFAAAWETWVWPKLLDWASPMVVASPFA